MIEYPKIETLYNRDPETFKVIPTLTRLKEFSIVNSWYVTEKIDGTNIRISWDTEAKTVTFGGRTDNAQIPSLLVNYLQDKFTPEVFAPVFDSSAILFGEGYGEKIQKVGGLYRKGVSFRLFDVLVGNWWLEPESLNEIAASLGIHTVPAIEIIQSLPKTLSDLWDILKVTRSLTSILDDGAGCEPEGIVARSYPLLLTCSRARVMWKLKIKDF
jgi:hypothetical protein